MTTKKNFSVNPNQSSSESLLKDIRRNTKRIFTSEQKVLIVKESVTSIVLPSSAVNIVYQIALTTNGIRILSRPTKLAAQKIKYILLLSTVTTFVYIIYYCLPSNSFPPVFFQKS